MFHAADLMLVNKVDLLPYVQFDVDAAVEYARRVRPGLPAMRVSATTGEGFAEWLAWLERGVRAMRAKRDSGLASPRGSVTDLESDFAAKAEARPAHG
jgi:hydrogenase nickel incorporation protein HypB